MEGNYSGYFEILVESLKNANSSLILDIDSNEKCIIFIKYQISKGVTLNGSFELGDVINIEKDQKIFKKINQKFIFDFQKIFEAKFKEKDEIIKELNEKIALLNNEFKGGKKQDQSQNSNINNPLNSQALQKDSMKKKPITDLINPNRKKIRGKGAKFDSTSININNIKEKTDVNSDL